MKYPIYVTQQGAEVRIANRPAFRWSSTVRSSCESP